MCCGPWSWKERHDWVNWTELNWKYLSAKYLLQRGSFFKIEKPGSYYPQNIFLLLNLHECDLPPDSKKLLFKNPPQSLDPPGVTHCVPLGVSSHSDTLLMWMLTTLELPCMSLMPSFYIYKYIKNHHLLKWFWFTVSLLKGHLDHRLKPRY